MKYPAAHDQGVPPSGQDHGLISYAAGGTPLAITQDDPVVNN